MNIIKKQGIGAWVSLGTVVMALIGLIIYGVVLRAGNGVQTANGGQMFLSIDQPEFALVTVGGVLALVFAALSIALSQFQFEGLLGKVCEMVVGALRIVVPALLMFAFLQFLYGTLTGLGWTFFSNEELEINPEAITAGKLTITAMIFFIISMIASIVAAFFKMVKKDA